MNHGAKHFRSSAILTFTSCGTLYYTSEFNVIEEKSLSACYLWALNTMYENNKNHIKLQ